MNTTTKPGVLAVMSADNATPELLEIASKAAKRQYLGKSAGWVTVKITYAIANEYNDRAPEFVPEALWMPGVYMVSIDCAKFMRSDAEDYASGTCFDGVRPGVRRAYGALAKQLDAALAAFRGES